jgi:hypothetical protein
MRAAFLKQSEGQRDLVQEKPKAWVAVKLARIIHKKAQTSCKSLIE